MPESRQVEVYGGYPGLRCDPAAVDRCITLLDQWRPQAVATGEISVALLTDSALASLHQTFLDDPSFTDVMTFPPDEADCGEFAGEICLSVDAAIRASAEHGCTPGEEITRYLVHGWLHLSGLDDKTETDAANMRTAENDALDWLRRHRGILKTPIDTGSG